MFISVQIDRHELIAESNGNYLKLLDCAYIHLIEQRRSLWAEHERLMTFCRSIAPIFLFHGCRDGLLGSPSRASALSPGAPSLARLPCRPLPRLSPRNIYSRAAQVCLGPFAHCSYLRLRCFSSRRGWAQLLALIHRVSGRKFWRPRRIRSDSGSDQARRWSAIDRIATIAIGAVPSSTLMAPGRGTSVSRCGRARVEIDSNEPSLGLIEGRVRMNTTRPSKPSQRRPQRRDESRSVGWAGIEEVIGKLDVILRRSSERRRLGHAGGDNSSDDLSRHQDSVGGDKVFQKKPE